MCTDEGPFAVDYSPAWTRRTAGVTFQLTNSSDCAVDGLTILSSPTMAVTGFNGGGGHTFRRLAFAPPRGNATVTVSRDAMHFSDLRRGPVG